MEVVKEVCCPVFLAEKWNEKTFQWENKKFIKASVPTFFHIPLSPMIGNRIKRLMKRAEDTHKLSDNKDEILLLFTDPHAFK